MIRHALAALARGTVAVATGSPPFVAAGVFVSWWLAAGLLAVGVAAAAWWWTRSPWRCLP